MISFDIKRRLYRNCGFGRLNAAGTASCLCRNGLWSGKNLGVRDEPPRAHVVGRYNLAAHGPADQPDGHPRRMGAGRTGRIEEARGSTRRWAALLPALSPKGRVHSGGRLLARRSEIRPRPPHEARAPAGKRRQAGARTLCRRPRLGAARSEPSAVADPHRREVRGRRRRGVPPPSRHRGRHRANGGHDVPRRWGRTQLPSRHARGRRRLAADPDGAGRRRGQHWDASLDLDTAHGVRSRAQSLASCRLSARRSGRRRRTWLSAFHAERQRDPLQGQAAGRQARRLGRAVAAAGG